MILMLLLFTALGLHASPNPPDQTTELLRAQDQALLDAFAPGDRKVWDRALAADAVYVDETGAIMSRGEFLKQLEPLPAGASGSIQIASYSAHISGDVATVIHTDDEQENYHGQMLHALYLTTETWHREAAEWKLQLVHTYAVLADPPAISLPAEALQQYAGRYVAGDLVYLVQWDGKQLAGGREAGPMRPLQVEVRDVFFVAGQPRVRKIFQRDESGHVTGFVNRREGRDLVWRRAPAAPKRRSPELSFHHVV